MTHDHPHTPEITDMYDGEEGEIYERCTTCGKRVIPPASNNPQKEFRDRIRNQMIDNQKKSSIKVLITPIK